MSDPTSNGGLFRERAQSTHGPVLQDEPKVWNLTDYYEFAPNLLEGDQWQVLLDPLLVKDKLRCDAWKAEVENLLIFAGLFSAVVTAFIVESYKSLQPDPNQPLIYVLSQLAATLNVSANGVANPLPVSATLSHSFAPTNSAVRVNSFWFISLVLSLTTVLIGIICLQWLREHQSYPDISPKETLAVYHMRSEGLEKWFVPEIFTALPLLLQAALSFFFGGLIDFLLSFGQNKVAVPAIIVVGLTLLFLIMTTIFPTLQGFRLYIPFVWLGDRPPAQCPYKSPQSRAFRIVCNNGFRFYSRFYAGLSSLCSQVHRRLQQSTSERTNNEMPEGVSSPLIPFIGPTWSKKDWMDFDLSWLLIREAYGQGKFSGETGLHSLQQGFKRQLPLYDISLAVRDSVDGDKVLHTEKYLSAAYHCLHEISASIIGKPNFPEDPEKEGYYLRRNDYLRSLLSYGSEKTTSGTFYFSQFLNIRMPEYEVRPNRQRLNIFELLHHDNVLSFLSHMLRRHYSPEIVTHQVELKTRIMRYLYSENFEIRPPSEDVVFPEALLIRHTDLTTLDEKADDFYFQYAHILQIFLGTYVTNTYRSNDSRSDIFHGHFQTFLCEASTITLAGVNDLAARAPYTVEAFMAIFRLIADRLRRSTASRRPITQPSLLFYGACLYIDQMTASALRSESYNDLYMGIDSLLPVMQEYLARWNADSRDTGVFTITEKRWWQFLMDLQVDESSMTSAKVGEEEFVPPKEYWVGATPTLAEYLAPPNPSSTPGSHYLPAIPSLDLIPSPGPEAT